MGEHKTMSFVKATDPVKYNFFNKEPFSSQMKTFVYKNDAGEYRVVEGGEQLTNTELKGQKYTTRFTLECSPVKGYLQTEIPSSDEDVTFETKLNYSFDVVNPVSYVRMLADKDIKTYVKESIRESVKRYVRQFSIEDLDTLKKNFPNDLEVSDLEDAGLHVEITGEIDLTPKLKELVKEQFHLDIDENFPSADVDQEFFVHATVHSKIGNPALYIKSGITSMPPFVNREIKTQLTKLVEKYYVYELEELQANFPKKLNVSSLESKGIHVTVEGDVDYSKVLKKQLSEKVNLKYVKEYPSEIVGENFEVTLQAIIRIKDRISFLQSDITALEQYVKDALDMQINNITQKYTKDDDSIKDLRDNLVPQLDLFDFETKGLEVNVKTVVELSQELKRSIQTHRSKQMEIVQQKDLRNLELEELIDLCKGTPFEYIILTEKDPEKIRAKIYEKLNKYEEHLDRVTDSYIKGNTDAYDYQEKMKVISGGVRPSQQNQLKIEEPKEERRKENTFSQSATLLEDEDLEDKDFS